MTLSNSLKSGHRRPLKMIYRQLSNYHQHFSKLAMGGELMTKGETELHVHMHHAYTHSGHFIMNT